MATSEKQVPLHGPSYYYEGLLFTFPQTPQDPCPLHSNAEATPATPESGPPSTAKPAEHLFMNHISTVRVPAPFTLHTQKIKFAGSIDFCYWALLPLRHVLIPALVHISV